MGAAVAAGLPAFTVSFGVAEDTGGEDLSSLLARADAALFQAKQAGRDRVVVHGEPNPAVDVLSERPVGADLESVVRRKLR